MGGDDCDVLLRETVEQELTEVFAAGAVDELRLPMLTEEGVEMSLTLW